MPSNVNWPGFERLDRKLGRLGKITFAMIEPLLEEYERILVEGNRRKVLGGLDGKGQPMTPVTYRGGSAGVRTAARRGENFGQPKHPAMGRNFGGAKPRGDPHAHGNLTTAEYKKLNGPPLAPRGEKSRVIANLETAIGQDGGKFYAVKAWRDVLSAKGVKFLPAHFVGKGRLPKRDLRGVDAKEVEAARKATRTWVKFLLSEG